MGANQSAPAEVGEPSNVGHDMDSDQWTEEFSKEYNRLRHAEIKDTGEPEMQEDGTEYDEALVGRGRAGALPRVPLQEMMVKESLSEIQSILGPVIAPQMGGEGAGAENRFSCAFDAAGDHRGGEGYELSHGMRKRSRLGSPHHRAMVAGAATGDPRDIPMGLPMEHAYATTFSGGHEGGGSCEGRGVPMAGCHDWSGHGERGRGDGGAGYGGSSEDAGLSYCYGADPVQRANVSELNATMEAALSALYDNSTMTGGTPQFTVRSLRLPRPPATSRDQPPARSCDAAGPTRHPPPPS